MELTAEQTERKPLTIWLLLASLYMTQSLGLGFFWIALVVIMRGQGAPLERLGHYRGWLFLTQNGMVLSLVVIGCFDIATQFGAVLAGCVVLAFFSSTQDIAVDGLACRLLSAKERGLGSGIQYAGMMLGNVVGGGAVLMVYPHIGWKGCMMVLAFCTSVSLFQVLCFRETTCPVGFHGNNAFFLQFWRYRPLSAR